MTKGITRAIQLNDATKKVLSIFNKDANSFTTEEVQTVLLNALNLIHEDEDYGCDLFEATEPDMEPDTMQESDVE